MEKKRSSLPFRCRLCGHERLKPLYRASHYVGKPEPVLLYRCQVCHAVSSDDPAPIYEETFFERCDAYVPGTDENRQRNELFRERAQYLRQQVGLGRILDVGCARGDFLTQAAAMGFETYGIEISRAAAAIAVSREHRIVNASAERLPFGSNRFVAVHMNHVLEHLEEPLAALRSIYEVLQPGGVVIVEVPNEIGTLAVRVKLWAGRLGTPSTEQIRYAPHLTYFDRHSLCYVVRAAGFVILRERIRFYSSITPLLRTVPAQVARWYDRVSKCGDLLEVTLVKPAEQT